VTDANLFLRRLLPEFFPKIFGETEDQPLDSQITATLFRELADEINRDRDRKMTPEEVAYGFINVANEAMARPIRALTEARGYDTSRHRLATFGGAGGQHSCAIAESLGISQILIHRYSSVLSAYGMALADVVHEVQEPSSAVFSSKTEKGLRVRVKKLQKKATEELKSEGFDEKSIRHEMYLNMRYQGTDTALMIIKPDSDWDFGKAFVTRHRQEFGFTLPDRAILVDDIRVRGIGQSFETPEKTVDQQLKELKPHDVAPSKKHSTQMVYFTDGYKDTDIFVLHDLSVGDKIPGPAIIIDSTQTIVVVPNSTALILSTHVIINLGESHGTGKKANAQTVDPIILSIFSHRFMAIAEQMGRALQNTSVSTNVKERLDYSCALFDSKGGLVANAPHLPVHLGSMSTAVKRQSEIWRGRLKRGDVIVANHPQTGGTHLPDITVITPAFNGDKIVFYVASRAHHADIGGILPGSMPPHSKEIFQEGAAIKSEKLVSEGRFEEEKITQLLLEEPAKHPGCSGTRCLRDNINDLVSLIRLS
jgi:5-oxoprolinase (ATP-hydrolysing)